ncbi:MAG: hypothetical protein RLZZ500_2136 [Bacteroidota bacterium]|jgi:hypothetical protein
MKIRPLFFGLFFFITQWVAAQAIKEIETEDGKHFITTTCEYPIFGTYQFKGMEPVVELNSGGTGQYQQHDAAKRPMIWGLECSESGELKATKGYDNVKYILYYKFTTPIAGEPEESWIRVEMTVHLNSGKIFINGERMKLFSAKEEKKKS